MKHEYKVKSGDSGNEYLVTDDDGVWSCTCMHWIIRCRRSGTACKHIDQIKRHLREQDRLMADFEMDWETPLETLRIQHEYQNVISINRSRR